MRILSRLLAGIPGDERFGIDDYFAFGPPNDFTSIIGLLLNHFSLKGIGLFCIEFLLVLPGEISRRETFLIEGGKDGITNYLGELFGFFVQ